MSFPWAAAIQAGGQMGISMLGNLAQINQNEVNRKWAAGMASTEMQRRVADLRAAGLNPILAAGSLSGADVGTPSPANIDTPDLAGAINSGLRYDQERKRVQIERELAGAEIAKKASEVELNLKVGSAKEAEELATRVNAARVVGLMALDAAQADLSRASAKSTRAGIPVKEAQGKIGSNVGNVLDLVLGRDPVPKSIGEWWEGTGIPGGARKVEGWLKGAWESASDMYRVGAGNAPGGAHSARDGDRKQEIYNRGADAAGVPRQQPRSFGGRH